MQANHDKPEHATETRHPRRWQDVVALAQVDVAAVLARAIAHGSLDRDRYQDWLAMESVACRVSALSLDTVACWHGAQPALRATAQTWAAELRELAQVAARDVRVIDGVAATPPTAMGHWHAFACSAGGSQRAGEVLGGVLLHGRLYEGPVRAVATAILTMPFSHGGQYLVRRLRADTGIATHARDALLDVYSASALAVGAQRAAGWYHAALASSVAKRAAA
ncbi:hypothetical protein ACFPOA_13070 [Lysobacter niabensis]|uniref:hypothetical protein n=1 Tax=Agrilutibacter niabensis TaxID=380628 RepID=UPI003618116C